MSVHLISRSFYTPLPAHLKLTLIALADEANDDGTSICVGQKKLATKCGVSERSVRDHLKDLVTHGIIRKLDGRHPLYLTDQYEIAVERLGEKPAATSSALGADRKPSVSPDRKPSVDLTGSPLPPTQLLTREYLEASFDRFWKIYPKRVGRRACEAAFARVLRKIPLDVVLAGAIAYRDDPKRSADYTANPLTWLNQGRWDDELVVDKPGTSEMSPTDWTAYYRDQDERIAKLLEDEDGAA